MPTIRWADLDLGGGQVLELIQYLRPAGVCVSAKRFSDPGAGHHLAAGGERRRRSSRPFARSGIEIRSGPVELTEPGPWRGSRCFYALDPDGATVEIIERPVETLA